MNWVKSRLNRDNFWNLMFWFGTIISLSLTEFLAKTFEMGVFVFIPLILSLTAVPYILAKCNKVIHVNNAFLNKKELDITNNLPKNLSTVIVSTIVLTAFLYVPFIMLNGYIIGELLMSNFLGFVLLIPTIYFIYKNCPISILFNKKFLEKINSAVKTNNNSFFTHKKPYNSISSYKSMTSKNICTDSSYRGMSCNIYNRHHNK